jgi:hypothetical protein
MAAHRKPSSIHRMVLSNNHGGIHDTGDYQDQCQGGIAGIANLICNSEGDPDDQQMQKRSGLAGCQYEKSAGHREKEGYRNVVKHCCHSTDRFIDRRYLLSTFGSNENVIWKAVDHHISLVYIIRACDVGNAGRDG